MLNKPTVVTMAALQRCFWMNTVGISLSGYKVKFLQIWSPFHLSHQLHSLGRAVLDCLAVSVVFSLLPDGGNNVPCAEMKLQLSVMKRNLPLEKNRPDSEISSKMFLTIQRLTLQVRARKSQRKRPT
jgi:hypothetical protein